MEFLSAGIDPATLKVHVAAIFDSHKPNDVTFLWGVRHPMLKLTSLLALTQKSRSSSAPVSSLLLLSLCSWNGQSYSATQTGPDYILKVSSVTSQSVILQDFFTLPHSNCLGGIFQLCASTWIDVPMVSMPWCRFGLPCKVPCVALTHFGHGWNIILQSIRIWGFCDIDAHLCFADVLNYVPDFTLANRIGIFQNVLLVSVSQEHFHSITHLVPFFLVNWVTYVLRI